MSFLTPSDTPLCDISGLPKGQISLVGLDGNVFSVMGAVSKALRKAGWSKLQIEEYARQAMSSDYDNALRVSMTYTEAPPRDEDEPCNWCGDLHDEDFDCGDDDGDYADDMDDDCDEDDCDCGDNH